MGSVDRNDESSFNRIGGRTRLYLGQSLKGEGCVMQKRMFGNEETPSGTLSESLGREYLRASATKILGEALFWYRAHRNQSRVMPNFPILVYCTELGTVFELSNKTLLKIVSFKISNFFDL